jgi:hypothetical protein
MRPITYINRRMDIKAIRIFMELQELRPTTLFTSNWIHPQLLPFCQGDGSRIRFLSPHANLLPTIIGGTVIHRWDGDFEFLRDVRNRAPKDLILELQDEFPHWRTADAAALCEGVIMPSKNHPVPPARHRWLVPAINPLALRRVAADLPHLRPRLGGVAYAGGLNASQDFRDYRAVAAAMRDAEIPFYIYGANSISPALRAQYEELGAVVFDPLPYLDLIRRLRRHDWIWVGASGDRIYGVTRNALADAALAWVPVISWNLPDQDMVIKENKLGIVLNKLEDLRDVSGTIQSPPERPNWCCMDRAPELRMVADA